MTGWYLHRGVDFTCEMQWNASEICNPMTFTRDKHDYPDPYNIAYPDPNKIAGL